MISVASHIIPKAFLKTQAKEYLALIDLLFSEPNPMPVKAALKAMGLLQSSELRLPLVEMSGAGREKLFSEMKRKGVL